MCFDLELAKVMCDVSVLPSLVSPLQDVEVPPCSNAAEYAAPAFETVLGVARIHGPGGIGMYMDTGVRAGIRGCS